MQPEYLVDDSATAPHHEEKERGKVRNFSNALSFPYFTKIIILYQIFRALDVQALCTKVRLHLKRPQAM